MLITNLHLFNLSKQSNSFFNSIYIEINRKIDIFKIDGLTINEDEHSLEFIIHVKGEYDYRY